jgi:hypothetical protein
MGVQEFRRRFASSVRVGGRLRAAALGNDTVGG